MDRQKEVKEISIRPAQGLSFPKWSVIVVLMSILTSQTSNAQVLISLVFGDKLNSNKIEFGLDGGISMSNLEGLPISKPRTAFNLGFYFDIKLRDTSWMVHTGVMVKSSFGARKLPVYPLGDPELDAVFTNGSVTRKLGYFNVPVMMKYKFTRRFSVEAGPMISLMNKGVDEFINSVADDDDLIHTVKIKKQYHPLDFGLIGGVCYRLMKGHGLNLGVRYYFGFTDIEIDDSGPDVFNRSFYAYVGIPIGISKKARKASQKE
ncbi:porin family protein [Chryseolinea sp. T2]|uniref:porin family protein n=1 Tax=Chryseolinea sp. T2 TaxID=3129255 RepID=UPI003077A089